MGKSDGDLLDAYSRAVESVSLVVVGKNSPGWRGEQMGAGSGTTMSPEGYILTNNHVVHGAGRIEVRTADGTALTARLVGQLAIAIGNLLGFNSTVLTGVLSALGKGVQGPGKSPDREDHPAYRSPEPRRPRASASRSPRTLPRGFSHN